MSVLIVYLSSLQENVPLCPSQGAQSGSQPAILHCHGHHACGLKEIQVLQSELIIKQTIQLMNEDDENSKSLQFNKISSQNKNKIKSFYPLASNA